MADIFIPPTEEQRDKLLEFTGDALGFFLMQTSIRAMQKLNPENIDFQESWFGEWKYFTRRLLWKFGLYQIVEHVYKLAEQDASEYWKDWKPSEVEEVASDFSIDPTAKALSEKIKITDIGKKYGLKVKRNKAMCPFHEGNSPSLSFSNERGLFNCFGCEAKGDLISFVRMMEGLKK